MYINLIGQDNGFGLSRDLSLLSSFLSERHHHVRIVDVLTPSQGADVNIYVELFDPMHLATADKHVGIFNLEWFRPAWTEHLPSMTQLWAKSVKALEWYRERGHDQAVYTGFTSRDMLDRTVTRRPSCIHVAGASRHKNTAAVLEAWRQFGKILPPLTIVADNALFEPLPGVTQWARVSDDKLRELMNEHVIHVCPSEIEGWGHYIVEALSCRAIVVTCDGSPMTEHVLPTFGELIMPTRVETRGGLDYCYPTPMQVGNAVRKAQLAIDDRDTWISRSQAARAWWAKRHSEFVSIADELIKELAR